MVHTLLATGVYGKRFELLKFLKKYKKNWTQQHSENVVTQVLF